MRKMMIAALAALCLSACTTTGTGKPPAPASPIEQLAPILAPLAGRAASAYDTATISMHNTSDEVEELNLRPLDGETPPSHTQPAVKNPRAALGKRVRVTMDRPRPVPLRSPLGLAVVKKRSPSLPRRASRTPGPWSCTIT